MSTLAPAEALKNPSPLAADGRNTSQRTTTPARAV
jgi:hypothetical protein